MYNGRSQDRWAKYCLLLSVLISCLWSLVFSLTSRFFSVDAVVIAVHPPPPPAECMILFMISPYQIIISSLLYPPPHTLLCSVLLWTCASALQTLLKSLSGLTLPFFLPRLGPSCFCWTFLWCSPPLNLFFYCFLCTLIFTVRVWLLSEFCLCLMPFGVTCFLMPSLNCHCFDLPLILSFFQTYVYTVGGFAFLPDLLSIIDYTWDQSGKYGHTECGQRIVQWQMS